MFIIQQSVERLMHVARFDPILCGKLSIVSPELQQTRSQNHIEDNGKRTISSPRMSRQPKTGALNN